MSLKNRMKTTPVPVVRQGREVSVRAVTTMDPGVIAPIAAFNLLRMDSCTGRISVAVEMNETFEVMVNRTFVRLSAWFFPHVANDRFEQSPTIFERSFNGEPMVDGSATVVPFIETAAHGAVGANAVYKTLGLSAPPAAMVNTAYLEAYNQIVNYIRRQRSKSLDERLLTATSLAPALWGDSAFGDVVPDFDDAMIAGELPLTVVEADLRVRGVGIAPGTTQQASVSVKESNGISTVYGEAFNSQNVGMYIQNGTGLMDSYPDVWAELSENGISVSLANIDQARALVDWAKIREGFEGHKQAWVIDSLMAGIEVPEQAWFHPMLLDQKMVEIKQLKRMATDYANIEEGVANGVGGTTLGINVPPNTYGGVVMILAEAIPEQLYERQADPYFMASGVDDLPNYMRDVLNPMPVVEVKNGEVDVDHSAPTGLFGWARRNWQWARWPTRVGGDLFAPDADAATTIARRSIWATDVADPELSEDFYVATSLGKEVFVDQTVQPFKIGVGGKIGVTGLTVIGEVYESEANYDEVRAAIPPLVRPVKP